jgi:hypothetical protein
MKRTWIEIELTWHMKCVNDLETTEDDASAAAGTTEDDAGAAAGTTDERQTRPARVRRGPRSSYRSDRCKCI